ncbi:phage scaffolding protein [Paucisalibacillus globulus]|uniref:phage scaffolding protein n=1 Tax=Paucisalibacillus globulus TaxID=351095 RepID=UPI000BB90E5D|nr:phage scaffolding protein [Paucisalibacillus globulus]
MEWLKELLKNAGVEESKIDGFVTGFNKEVPKHFIPKETYNTLAETKKQLDADLKARDEQLEELKKVDAAGLEAKIVELQKSNETAKTEFEAKLKETQLTSALKLALTGKVHDVDLVAGLIDKEKIELNEDGTVKSGLEEQEKSLRESKTFLFVPEKKDPGFKGFIPSGGTGGGDPNVDIGSNFAKIANEKSQAPKNENGPWA